MHVAKVLCLIVGLCLLGGGISVSIGLAYPSAYSGVAPEALWSAN